MGIQLDFSGKHAPKITKRYNCVLAVEQMILEAFNETMTDVEARMETRVRIGGPDRDRTTGNMVYASFIHTTGRPIEGICDPHWHIHAFTFNPQEKRWKAGQFGNMPLRCFVWVVLRLGDDWDS